MKRYGVKIYCLRCKLESVTFFDKERWRGMVLRFSGLLMNSMLISYKNKILESPDRENNRWLQKKDQREKFINDPSKQLCVSAIESRSIKRVVMGIPYLQATVEIVLGQYIIILSEGAIADTKVIHGSRGATPIVSSCYICRDKKQNHRNTWKCWDICVQPVYDEHSETKPICMNCKTLLIYLE
ncbi:unnamed protein product [Lepeophtheirus salmonis]|uniref:(salmon louse) hypothetical protein n=1 Tax=Lepeophtheirus salmonis TaxID=72036 RepID=A0A7R8D0Z2_LEPSM|nr:unnamed protein product [Lepeophtheirus salmonis]CAF2945867.1 unnamed protein product [Lepeophtheirus salmonis]